MRNPSLPLDAPKTHSVNHAWEEHVKNARLTTYELFMAIDELAITKWSWLMLIIHNYVHNLDPEFMY